MITRKALVAVAIALIAASPGMADTKTWTSSGTAGFTSANWSPSGTPGSGDDLTNGASATGPMTFSASIAARSLTTANTNATAWVIGTSGADLGALSFSLSGTLTKAVSGTTLTLRNAATGVSSLSVSANAIEVAGGTLNLGSTTLLQALSNVTAASTSVASGGVLNISVVNSTGNSFSLGSLTNNGTLRLAERATGSDSTIATVSALSGTDASAVIEAHDASGRTASLVIDSGSSSGTSAYAGILRNGAAASASLQVTKSGQGTQILGGANTYTGATTVAAGTLLVNGTHTGAGNYAVSAGARLGGSGTITPGGTSGISVASSGIVSPGNGGIGTLTLDSGSSTASSLLALAAGAALEFDLDSAGPGSFLSDRIALVNGTANDISFNGNAIAFTDLSGGSLAPGQYLLFSSDAAGSFAGLSLAGGVITGGLSIGSGLNGYAGSTLNLVGNDIYLTVAPEPRAWMMVGLAVGLCFLRRRSAA